MLTSLATSRLTSSEASLAFVCVVPSPRGRPEPIFPHATGWSRSRARSAQPTRSARNRIRHSEASSLLTRAGRGESTKVNSRRRSSFNESPNAECRDGMPSFRFCFARGMPRGESTARSALFNAYKVSTTTLFDISDRKHGARRVDSIKRRAIEHGNRSCPPAKRKC